MKTPRVRKLAGLFIGPAAAVLKALSLPIRATPAIVIGNTDGDPVLKYSEGFKLLQTFDAGNTGNAGTTATDLAFGNADSMN